MSFISSFRTNCNSFSDISGFILVKLKKCIFKIFRINHRVFFKTVRIKAKRLRNGLHCVEQGKKRI